MAIHTHPSIPCPICGFGLIKKFEELDFQQDDWEFEEPQQRKPKKIHGIKTSGVDKVKFHLNLILEHPHRSSKDNINLVLRVIDMCDGDLNKIIDTKDIWGND